MPTVDGTFPWADLLKELGLLRSELTQLRARLDSWDRSWTSKKTGETFHQLSTVGTVFSQERKG